MKPNILKRYINLTNLSIGKTGRVNWLKSSKDSIIDGVYNGVEFKFLFKDYNKTNSYVTIEYLNKEYTIFSVSLVKCAVGAILGLFSSEYKIEIGSQFIDYDKNKTKKRDITIIDRKKEKNKKGQLIKYYKIKCNKCGFNSGHHWHIKDKQYKDEYWVMEHNILGKKTGCPCCGTAPKIVVEDINSIYKTDPWMIPYIGEDIAKINNKCSTKKIRPRCLDCGRISKKSIPIHYIYQSHSIKCSCGDGNSYISKHMFNMLEQLKLQKQIIDFDIEKKYDWCEFYNTYKKKYSTGVYDFIIEDMRLIIETDGDFHRKDNNMNGQTKEESKFIDDEKDRLALEHGYKVIRISDENDIEQSIFESDLNELFDLSNIDWLKCHEFGLSNRVKEACELKKNNPNLTTGDISKIMKINKGIAKEYLIKGTVLKWCYYNAEDEVKKNYENNIKRIKEKNSIPIKMYNRHTKKFLGMFESANELERQSEKLFGVKLHHGSISRVCLGQRNYYIEYTFKRVTKEEYQQWLNNKELHNRKLVQAC